MVNLPKHDHDNRLLTSTFLFMPFLFFLFFPFLLLLAFACLLLPFHCPCLGRQCSDMSLLFAPLFTRLYTRLFTRLFKPLLTCPPHFSSTLRHLVCDPRAVPLIAPANPRSIRFISPLTLRPIPSSHLPTPLQPPKPGQDEPLPPGSVKSVLPCTPLAIVKVLEHLGVYNRMLAYGDRARGKVITVINR